jgi:hypothetical protein
MERGIGEVGNEWVRRVRSWEKGKRGGGDRSWRGRRGAGKKEMGFGQR